MNYKKIVLTGVIVLILDFMVLKILGFGDIFIKMLNKIQGKTETKIFGALLVYLILTSHRHYNIFFLTNTISRCLFLLFLTKRFYLTSLPQL